MRGDSHQAALMGSTEQEIISEYQWNDRGQRLAEIDQAGNVTEYLYYPENDPDGDGIPTFSVFRTLGTEPIGYLAGVVSDARDSPRRISPVESLALQTQVHYDEVGNTISTLDTRGVLSLIEVNALNEVVTMTGGADVSMAVDKGELITGESPLAYMVRMRRDYNGRVVLNEIENRNSNTPGVGAFIEHSFTYDILGNTVSIEKEIDATSSIITEYRYDENENLVSVKQPEGNEVLTTYDERDLVLTVTQGAGSPEASTVTFEYDQNSNRVIETDAEDTDGDGDLESKEYVYDGFDRLTEVVDALGNQVVKTYDPANNVIRSQRFGHPAGQPSADNVLLGESFHFYDELNRRYRVDDALFVSDGFNPSRTPNLLDEDSDGFVTGHFEYDALGRRTHTIEDDDQTTETVYDGLSREIAAIDAMGNMTVTDYDSNSNAIRVSNVEVSEGDLVPEQVFETYYVYDQFNRLVRATDDAGQTTRFAYDSRNSLISISDPVGPPTEDPLGIFPGQINGPGNTVSYVYDGLSRRIAEASDLRVGGVGDGEIDTTNPENADGMVALLYEWDGNSRLAAIVDDSGNRTSYEYDALDRLVRQVNAKTDEVTDLTYDRDSNLIELVDANGTSSARGFDALNRPTSIIVDRAIGVAGTTEEIFEFDGLSRLTLTSDNNGGPASTQVLEFVYDSLGRVLEEQQNGQVVSSVFTGDGKRVEHTLPGGRELTRTFDLLDRIKEINDTTSGSNFIAGMDWIGPGWRELRRSHGNNTVMSYLNDTADAIIGYDEVNRVIRSRLFDQSNAVILDREYGYNRADVNTFEQRNDDSGLTDNYVYDSMYRVVSSSFDVGDGGVKRSIENLAYTYDGVGNRAKVRETDSISGIRDILYTVNEVNEYIEVDGVSQDHSMNGNLLDNGTHGYAYDYKNRLVEVVDSGGGGTIATYLYHSDNRRSAKIVGETETRFYYDGWQVCEEQDESGNTLVTYVYSPANLDVPVELERTAAHPLGPGEVYMHQNGGLNVVATTDSAGILSEKRFYDEFGQMYDENKQLVTSSSDGNPYGFQGRRLDSETGLYYYRNRFYDPATGRFLQRDPVWDPSNAGNQYAFVGNSPISSFDPLGLENCDRGALQREKNRLEQERWDHDQERDRLFEEREKLSAEIEANQMQLEFLRGRLAGKNLGELLKSMGWSAVPFSSEIDFVRGEGSRLQSGASIVAGEVADRAVLKYAPRLAAKEILWVSGGGAAAAIVGEWVGHAAEHFYSRSWIKSHIETYMGVHDTQMQLADLLHEKTVAENEAIKDLDDQLKEIEKQIKECDKKSADAAEEMQRKRDAAKRRREEAKRREAARRDLLQRRRAAREYNQNVKKYNAKIKRINRQNKGRRGWEPMPYKQYRRIPRR